MAREFNADIELIDGQLQGWEIMIKVVTNGLGMAAVTDQANNVLHGPTADMTSIGEFLTTYMTED